MTTFIGIAPNLRAILAPHVAFELVDGSGLRPANDVQRHRLVRVAAEAANLKIKVSGIQRIAQSWRWLGGSPVPEHTLVPSHAGEPVRLLSRVLRSFRGGPNRTAVDGFARLGAHRRTMRPAAARSQAATLRAMLKRMALYRVSLFVRIHCSDRRSSHEAIPPGSCSRQRRKQMGQLPVT